MISLISKLSVLKNFNRILNVRTMASGKYLVDDPKFSFLKDLGLERSNKGVYNGAWTGNGEVNCNHF